MKTEFDVIIAGAGIIGLAAGLKILEIKPDARLLILEKEDVIAKHQTGHNSGVIHSGIYYKPGSYKARNCIEGYNKLIDFCRRENVPYEICGKVIVAVNESELKGLDKIYERGVANGLDKIRKIDKDELKELEPHARGVKAIHVPYTGIIDFKIAAKKYADVIHKKGGDIKLNRKVTSVKDMQNILEVVSEDCSFTTRVFINCCGLYSDEIAKLTGDSTLQDNTFQRQYYKLSLKRGILLKIYSTLCLILISRFWGFILQECWMVK
jgi:L-2-hydroxyglutarate oxidase